MVRRKDLRLGQPIRISPLVAGHRQPVGGMDMIARAFVREFGSLIGGGISALINWWSKPATLSHVM
jgi:hypothetical protein